MLYTGTVVQEYRSNQNIFFACHSHVVWCPKYRRKVLVGPIEARLKQLISEGCREHQAEIEELEVMPDHVQRYGQCGPSIRDSSAHQADQRAFLALLAAGVSRFEAEEARVSGRTVILFRQQAVRLFPSSSSLLSNKNMSHKTFQYRLYPTKKQETTLLTWLKLLCETYNAALQERRDAYRLVGKSIGFSHQCAELPACREVRPDLAEVPSQVLQDAVKRVDLAFDGFFRRCAAGEKAGYPRYKSCLRYDSMTFKQYGNSFSLEASPKKNRGTLILAKLGPVKMVMHRPLQGTAKTAIVKRTPTGKWWVSIGCADVPEPTVPASEKEVGIDVGLKTFAYLSDGTTIENPRFFRQEEKNLAKAQRNREKAPQKSKERKKLKKRVARVHERTKNRRKDFAHQQSRKMVNAYGLIAVEALVVRNMIKNPKLSKSIADAAWSQFFELLGSKAEEAGRTVVKVNPAYTSQRCSCCGHLQQMPLSVRVYDCPDCGLLIDRDHNGSKNILADGLNAVGRHSRVIPEASGL